jgi:adenine deaminase
MSGTKKALENRIDAAMGRVPCDLVLTNVTYLDLFHLKWRKGHIGIHEGMIVSVQTLDHSPKNLKRLTPPKAKRTLDGRGKKLVPGFIDAHVHIESSLVVPTRFEEMVLPRGTTTVIADPHELSNVVGAKALEYFTGEALKLSLDLRVMLSSCVPATNAGLETNGGGILSAKDLRRFQKHPKVLGLAEMMNVPGVLFKDPDVLEKLADFTDHSGSRLDGHCPLLSGRELSAYASTGISSCHESSEKKEAAEKLSNGIRIWIREGSVAKDLKALVPLLSLETGDSMGFCTDDRNPLDIATEGHLDHLIREAIRAGIDEKVVYRSSSWSVARHYGLDQGPNRKGAIAPGYEADLVLLENSKKCKISEVFRRGVPVSEILGARKKKTSPAVNLFPGTVRAKLPTEKELEGPTGKVNVIGVKPGKIITDHLIEDSNAPGVHRITVLERH